MTESIHPESVTLLPFEAAETGEAAAKATNGIVDRIAVLCRFEISSSIPFVASII